IAARNHHTPLCWTNIECAPDSLRPAPPAAASFNKTYMGLAPHAVNSGFRCRPREPLMLNRTVRAKRSAVNRIYTAQRRARMHQTSSRPPPRSTTPCTCRCTIPGRRCGCTRLARNIGDMRIFTVGHSNLEFEDFVEMIKAAGVTSIVDVRKLPGSRKYPWFNDDH